MDLAMYIGELFITIILIQAFETDRRHPAMINI